MGWLSLVGAGVSMLGQAEAARANLQQNFFTAGMLKNQIEANKKIALMTEGDIYEAAAFDLSRLYEDEAETVGQQKAMGAAQGLSMDSKTMQDIIDNTFQSVKKDADMIITNRQRAAQRNRLNTTLANIGLKSQADMYRTAGRNAVKAGAINNLGSGISAMGQFYANKNAKKSLY